MRGEKMKISDKRLWKFDEPASDPVNGSFQQEMIDRPGKRNASRKTRLEVFKPPLLQVFVQVGKEEGIRRSIFVNLHVPDPANRRDIVIVLEQGGDQLIVRIEEEGFARNILVQSHGELTQQHICKHIMSIGNPITIAKGMEYAFVEIGSIHLPAQIDGSMAPGQHASQ